ncbi:MAG: hypothetical protein HFH32_04880 [Eubacterium sp.]|mgnify:CR=1 FL=1|jgi:hypothetical protein|nr:hypothetical protein [Eubacterium sp.]
MGKDTGNFSFCLLKIDRAIVEALRTALEVVMPEIMSDNNLRERNGYGQFRWNVIIAQLREQCQYLGWLDCETCTRGAWKTPVLFYTVSRNIITFMTEDTFRTVQRRKDKGKHYLCGGACFNQGVKAQYDQLKLDLPGISEDMEKWVAKSKEQLADAVHVAVGDIDGHVLVLFEVRADQLLSVRAVRLTPELEFSEEEEDWSKYIRMPFDAQKVIEPQQNAEEDEEELVELL